VTDIQNGNSTSSRREAAIPIFEALRKKVGIFLKECKSHVYRAPPAWIRAHKSSEFAHTRGRFESLLKCVFLSVLEENSISVAMVQLSIVIAMLETETFVAPSFDGGMSTQDHRGPVELETELRLVEEIDAFIQRESELLRYRSMQEVEDRLSDDAAVKAKHILLHGPIIERAKSMMKGHCCVYLTGISLDSDNSMHKMGTLRCSIVYGRSLAVGDDMYGRSLVVSDDSDDNLCPWKEGGFNLTTKLPFNGQEGLKNPLHSQTVANYLLRRTWMNKTAFWGRGIIDLIENAMDMEIEDSNQFSEAVF
jgi:hypothetical protein